MVNPLAALGAGLAQPNVTPINPDPTQAPGGMASGGLQQALRKVVEALQAGDTDAAAQGIVEGRAIDPEFDDILFSINNELAGQTGLVGEEFPGTGLAAGEQEVQPEAPGLLDALTLIDPTARLVEDVATGEGDALGIGPTVEAFTGDPQKGEQASEAVGRAAQITGEQMLKGLTGGLITPEFVEEQAGKLTGEDDVEAAPEPKEEDFAQFADVFQGETEDEQMTALNKFKEDMLASIDREFGEQEGISNELVLLAVLQTVSSMFGGKGNINPLLFNEIQRKGALQRRRAEARADVERKVGEQELRMAGQADREFDQFLGRLQSLAELGDPEAMELLRAAIFDPEGVKRKLQEARQRRR